MLKFIGGLVLGVVMSLGYVRWDYSLPKLLQFPDEVKGSVIAIAIDDILYDLDKPLKARHRALEVLFQNKSKYAVEVDAQFNNAFLNNLYRRQVIRQARQLRLGWSAYDKVLAKTPLREALEKKYGTNEPLAIKQAMLMDAFRKETFIAQWVRYNEAPVTKQNLLALLIKLGRAPETKP